MADSRALLRRRWIWWKVSGALLAMGLVSIFCLRPLPRDVMQFWDTCDRDKNGSCMVKPRAGPPAGADSPSMASDGPASRSTKRILFWVPFYNSPDYYFGLGREPFARCPVSDCETTTNRSLVNVSDAVVFHFCDTNRGDLPRWRSPSQRWVFFLMESPRNTYQDPKLFPGLFNWTMTYRSDSDILIRYGQVLPLAEDGHPEAAKSHQDRGSATNRSLASWLVSHCHTEGGREAYVAELRRHMPVDVFGKCYGRLCDAGPRCAERVYGEYKFYLSFENSVCRDYVTEKFFRALAHDTVPVVYGGADYASVAPPHSYVDASDFASPRHLAEHLKMLDGNDVLYRRYFRWKARYRVVDMPTDHFCDLCAKLHAATDRDTRVYEDLYDWWVTKNECAGKLVKLDY